MLKIIILKVDSLKTVQTTLENMVENINYWHSIELVIIIGVILFQLFYSLKVYKRIYRFGKIFKDDLFLKIAYVERAKIGSVNFDVNSIVFNEKLNNDEELMYQLYDDELVELSLVDTKGNNYVINKIKTAINTYLLNNYGAAVNFSIIKDIVDRETEVVDEEITQSVTLPLYLGLAATMVGIIFGLFSMPELSGDSYSLGINSLIGGVKIAMIGSLIGLICTVILSSFSYKKAKRTVQRNKNEQITYLQAKLLPELVKAEDTGVSGLKASLDRFARVATDLSDKVLNVMVGTRESLELQNSIIEKVDNLQVLKVSKWNFALFDKLEKNMDIFDSFSSYLFQMNEITKQLSEFSNRTSDINKVIDNIDNTLSESKQLTRFLSEHLNKIEVFGNTSLEAVGVAEKYFEESISELNIRTENMINSLYKSAGDHESQLEKIYQKIENDLNTITNQYIETFKDAYSNAVPKFSQLDKLDSINNTLMKLEGNKDILHKIDEIKDGLAIKNKKRNPETNIDRIMNTPISSSKPLKLGKVIKGIFSK